MTIIITITIITIIINLKRNLQTNNNYGGNKRTALLIILRFQLIF